MWGGSFTISVEVQGEITKREVIHSNEYCQLDQTKSTIFSVHCQCSGYCKIDTYWRFEYKC